MANWSDILEEVNKGSNYDLVRRKYLKQLSSHTGRNTITYYSGWLQKKAYPDETSINDSDKNGFMSAVNKLDPAKGLDLILHTPGGDTAATESIIYYLKSKFESIRVFVPQLALSAGTVIASAADEIWMGQQSSLGPIDPQFSGLSAHGVIEEFNRAYTEIKADQAKLAVWQFILQKYPPNFIGDCEKAIKWSDAMLENNLSDRMFADKTQAEKDKLIAAIKQELGDHSLNYAHNRHFSVEKCEAMGLVIKRLEDEQRLQDLVLSLHHANILTLTQTPAIKIIENNRGMAYIPALAQIISLGNMQPGQQQLTSQ
jgi:ClpP class serine protease